MLAEPSGDSLAFPESPYTHHPRLWPIGIEPTPTPISSSTSSRIYRPSRRRRPSLAAGEARSRRGAPSRLEGRKPPSKGPGAKRGGSAALLRLAALIVAAIAVAVVLVLWVSSCRGESANGCYSGYMGDVSAVTQSSSAVGKSLTDLLTTPGVTLEEIDTRLAGLSEQQAQVVDRAASTGFSRAARRRAAEPRRFDAAPGKRSARAPARLCPGAALERLGRGGGAALGAGAASTRRRRRLRRPVRGALSGGHEAGGRHGCAGSGSAIPDRGRSRDGGLAQRPRQADHDGRHDHRQR